MGAADEAYRRVLDDLFRLRRFGVKLDIRGPERALERLGSPTRGMPAVQIGGTNGKGSVAAMVASVLREAGLRVGLYTSPHLCRFTERIQIDGQEISREEVVSHYRRVRKEAPELTFFEVTTAMAALAFAEHRVAVAVVEVGLGGRLDATGVFEPVAVGLTAIGREHTAYLGQDLSRIAWEKGRLVRPGVPTATLAVDPEVLAVQRPLAEVLGVPWYELRRDFALEPAGDGFRYRGPGGPVVLDRLPLAGPHQADNVALALALSGLLPEALRPDEAARARGIARVQWPGRMEILPGPPRVLLDAGHNPQAVRALEAGLREIPRGRTVVVLAAMLDKELSDIVPVLLGLADEAVLTRVAYYRGAPPETLLDAVPEALRGKVHLAASVPEALDLARARCGPDDLLVVAGSVFLVGEARAHLLGEPTDPVQVTDPVQARPTAPGARGGG